MALAAGWDSTVFARLAASAAGKDSIVVARAIALAVGQGKDSTAFVRTAADNTDRPLAHRSNLSAAGESSCGQKMGHTPEAGFGNRLPTTRAGLTPMATSWGR
jgi:hypothetical protein